MRLIDVDALKEKKVYSHERHEKIVFVVEIDWMPTIDAIPVEWLKGLMLSTEDDTDEAEYNWIMREWESEKKEQEAR